MSIVQHPIKSKLRQACLEKIDQQVATITSVLDSIVTARNEETKSSAGDKYETSRAMLQIEEDKNKQQLARALVEHRKLLSIDSAVTAGPIRLGSLVTSSQGIYYIAVGVGKLLLDGVQYYCISPQSPIGMVIIGKRVSDQANFNDQVITILQVE